MPPVCVGEGVKVWHKASHRNSERTITTKNYLCLIQPHLFRSLLYTYSNAWKATILSSFYWGYAPPQIISAWLASHAGGKLTVFLLLLRFGFHCITNRFAITSSRILIIQFNPLFTYALLRPLSFMICDSTAISFLVVSFLVSLADASAVSNGDAGQHLQWVIFDAFIVRFHYLYSRAAQRSPAWNHFFCYRILRVGLGESGSASGWTPTCVTCFDV